MRQLEVLYQAGKAPRKRRSSCCCRSWGVLQWSRWRSWAWRTWTPWSWLLSLLSWLSRSRVSARICRGPCGELSGSGVSIGRRLARAIARHVVSIGRPRRRRGRIGLNHHMRRHRTGGIHHATSTKGPASRRHKPRRHKRPARARNTAVGTGGIEHDASAESRRPAAPSPRPASCRYTP